MIRKAMLTCAMLLVASIAIAWPFPPVPQCGPLPLCTDGCYEPATPKCEQWVADRIDEGAATCGTAGACEVAP